LFFRTSFPIYLIDPSLGSNILLPIESSYLEILAFDSSFILESSIKICGLYYKFVLLGKDILAIG
jgi:hypothetical protein